MHLQILAVAIAMTALGAASAEDELNCSKPCGDVTIEYPFGYEGCYYNSSFLVTCDQTSGEPTLFLGLPTTNLAITDMSIDKGELEIMIFVASDCYNISGPTNRNRPRFLLGRLGRDIRVSTKNKFVAIGCDTNAYFRGIRGEMIDVIGCYSSCGKKSIFANGSCDGVGCCEVALPDGISAFNITVRSNNNHTNITDFNPCSYGFFYRGGNFNFSTKYLGDFPNKTMPMLLEWAIGNLPCEIAIKYANTFQCKGKSECNQLYTGPGYRCLCLEGFVGNPYVADGCQRNYTCKCPNGYSGDGRRRGTGCTADQSMVIKIAVGSSAGVIVIIVFVNWLYFGLKKRKLMLLREKFFRQNGGIMLQQRMSRDKGSQDQAKVFTIDELKKATNNYDESRIIGKGGYGTVYKGVLSDNRAVAIKKSKIADQNQTQIEQFINEVIILSQINHRNVVKLIGCCLESEVPSLVYEFIPNGIVSDHLHNKSKSSAITWDIRLKIAHGTAEALSYLHSAVSIPIIHRDVKPTNILLDESYVAKVADFGASRLIPMDQIEVATMVQGTLGYLDPEYLQTQQLTDKSDVYSFGVVLVELLTGKNVLNFERREGERNQANHFLSSLKEGRVFQVLDEQLQQNEDHHEIITVSRLAERCLHVKGDERPTMKEVAMELEGILASKIQKHPWVQYNSNENEEESFLKAPTIVYELSNGVNAGSSTFDSMSNHSILPIASGRERANAISYIQVLGIVVFALKVLWAILMLQMVAKDTIGNYTCKCPNGYSGDGRRRGTGCTADQSMVIKIAVGSSAGVIVFIVFVNWLYFGLKKRKLMLLREKFFRQNGGIMLQQRMSRDKGSQDQAKVFTIDELKKATNNYDESRIIGKGGYDTVYKGVLSDNRAVAIKKSKIADQNQTQIEQFINEVIILSQINHRNVVKLIGCCLESEVPSLVYEFIPNGIVSDHLHNKSKSSAITWDIRLKIAHGTAEALSYLHSAVSIPIIHRDVKPTNILLDESYVAKVADFGASRLIPMDQIEVATMVQGTLGYLDPEYLQTQQLTDKSDVYSFGVVLVELLTGKNVLNFERREGERNQANHFLSSLKEGRVFQVLDEQLQQNEDHHEIITVSRLAERCLHVKGDERPTMKEVAMELEGILASKIQKHPWVQYNSNENEEESFLKAPTIVYELSNGVNAGSSTFDSMSNHSILPIASGRERANAISYIQVLGIVVFALKVLWAILMLQMVAKDTIGNYTCKCPNGYSGDGRRRGTGCTADQSMVIKIAVGSSAGVIVFIVFVNWLYFGLKKRKLMLLREKFFRQNGGIMLQQRLSRDKGSQDQAKVFTIDELKKATNNYDESRIIGIDELKKATNNYDESRIIGKGGYGTVYKGVLSDNRAVSIKKSKIADQNQT
ncbi:hypothetical protein LXL04_022420 [Taraxacum kok-saghyz]